MTEIWDYEFSWRVDHWPDFDEYADRIYDYYSEDQVDIGITGGDLSTIDFFIQRRPANTAHVMIEEHRKFLKEFAEVDVLGVYEGLVTLAWLSTAYPKIEFTKDNLPRPLDYFIGGEAVYSYVEAQGIIYKITGADDHIKVPTRRDIHDFNTHLMEDCP